MRTRKPSAIVILCLLAALLFSGPAAAAEGDRIVGTDVPMDAVNDFYYTYDPPLPYAVYQRYRFYLEDGAPFFFHETREGAWPQSEEDITASGTIPLSGDQWAAFFDLLSGGIVRPREESLTTGDSGPWLYLYWDGDEGACQEYSFASLGARLDFEAFCAELRASQGEP